MLETLIAMTAVAAIWLVWGAVFVGIGVSLAPHAIRAFDRPLRLLCWFWIGWCVVVAALQVWHFALPIDERAAAAVTLWGLAGIAMRWRVLLDRNRSATKTPGEAELTPSYSAESNALWERVSRLSMLAVVVLWASIALGPIENYDTGLYHLQAVRWNQTYPIVPGLGNLHGRLAYNNASLLYAAMIDSGLWRHQGHHATNGLLTLSVALTLLASLRFAASIALGHATSVQPTASLSGKARHLLRLALLGPTVLYSYKHATSFAPDLPATLLGIVISVILAELCLRPSQACAGESADGVPRGTGTHTARATVVCVTLFAAVGTTVKLSFGAGGLVAILVAARLTSTRLPARADRRSFAGPWCAAATLFVAILGVWMARGVVLSGYPVYPSTFAACNVAWRVPESWANEDRRTIVAWARQPEGNPEEVLVGVRWIGPWFLRQARDPLKVSLPVAITAACLFVGWRIRRRSEVDSYSLLPAVLPAFATVAFVVATAPDLARFTGASLWIVAAVAAVNCLHRLDPTSAAYVHARRTTCVVFAVLIGISVIKASLFVRGPGGFAPIPAVELKTFRTDSGLQLYAPREGDQTWDAPLPSTPYPQNDLRYIAPDRPESGFTRQ